MYKKGQYYQRRSGGIWIIVLIIIVCVVIYANSQGLIHLSLPNLGNFSLSSSNSSVQACIQKVDDCSAIINSKYDSNVTILNDSQAQTADDANSFLSTWKSSVQSGNISNYNVTSYPIVLVATRLDSSSGTKSPYVFICKSDGNLEEVSKSNLC